MTSMKYLVKYTYTFFLTYKYITKKYLIKREIYFKDTVMFFSFDLLYIAFFKSYQSSNIVLYVCMNFAFPFIVWLYFQRVHKLVKYDCLCSMLMPKLGFKLNHSLCSVFKSK